MFGGWTEIMDNTNPDICAPYSCTMSYVSGVDYSTCTSSPYDGSQTAGTSLADLGVFNFDSNSCPTGTGVLDIACFISPAAGAVGMQVTINVADKCTLPLTTITRNTYSAITQKRKDTSGTGSVSIAASLSDFIGVSNAICELSSC